MKGLFSFLALAVVLSSSAAFADQESVSLIRTPYDFRVDGAVSKDVYRTEYKEIVEPVQVPYTVRVPYQVEETYYTTENRCAYYPVQRRICENVQKCRIVPRQVCTQRQVCHIGPGGHKQCHIEKVCRTVNEKVCHVEQVCRTVVEQVWQCRMVQVPHTRIVTRYRDEIRYRTEYRKRIVEVKVFDHTYSVQVVVDFPNDAVLDQGQTETVHVRMVGPEQSPDVVLTVNSRFHLYVIESKTIEEGQIHFVLATIPSSLMDSSQVNLLQVNGHGSDTEIVIQDQAEIDDRLTTIYDLEVIGKGALGVTQLLGTAKLDRSNLIKTGSMYEYPVSVQYLDGITPALIRKWLDSGDEIIVRMAVSRTGRGVQIVNEGSIHFEKERVFELN